MRNVCLDSRRLHRFSGVWQRRVDAITVTTISKLLYSGALLACLLGNTRAEETNIDGAKLEAGGFVVGEILFDKNNVFDLDDERENNRLFQLVNRLHIMTKDETIRKHLLLQPGDPYSARLVAETERILRNRAYFYDVEIKPVNAADGRVDLQVVTRDVWTLRPGISASRSGGENKIGVELEERNLLGYGQQVSIGWVDDVDRTSNSFSFRDPHIGQSWVDGAIAVADNSDGHSFFAELIRPFYALDTRWSLGGTVLDDDRRSTFYSLGEEAAEYQHDRQFASLFGGWSKGLQNGWVRRYQTGLVFDDNRFTMVEDGDLPALLPEDRILNYPFLGIDLIEDQFETTRNKEQIGRTEDFYFGQRLSARLGYAAESFGADRDALVYSSSYSRGFGSFESNALLTSLWANGRVEHGSFKNATVGFSARFYRQQSRKRMFFSTLYASHGHELDLDQVVELGGDTGLRGYPLRYQTGDSKLLFTLEQRYFTDWYPFRLFRVGGAIFADVGRVWGENPTGVANQGWLRDVGFGLRFASTRSGFGNIVHVDIAFPLDGDASIDDVQFLVESKRSF